MEQIPHLTDEQKVKAYSCAKNIQDQLVAILNELLNEKSYKGYLKEKLEIIENDTKCILSMCKK